MTPTGGKATEESRIRAVINGWAEAIRDRDSTALAACFVPDAVVFDLVEPLQFAGADSVKKRAEQWLTSFQGPIDYEVRDLKITAGEQVAFCHSLNHVNGTTKQGATIDMWWRGTVCFAKIGGKWMVVHEHSSVPFDIATGEASTNLQPPWSESEPRV